MADVVESAAPVEVPPVESPPVAERGAVEGDESRRRLGEMREALGRAWDPRVMAEYLRLRRAVK